MEGWRIETLQRKHVSLKGDGGDGKRCTSGGE